MFFTFSIKAAVVPLPKTIANIDDITDAFRGVLKTKMRDLVKNYIVSDGPGQIVLTSNETIMCNHVHYGAGSPLAKLQHQIKNTGNKLSESVTYYGCGGNEIELREIIVTEGQNLQPISWNEFKEGKRSLKLKKNESMRLYSLLNGSGEEMVKIVIKRTAKGQNQSFYVQGQNFLTMIYEYGEERSRILCTAYGFEVKYNWKGSTWHSNWQFDSEHASIIAYRNPVEKVVFLDHFGRKTSEANYQKKFNHLVMEGAMGFYSSILSKTHFHFFPPTEAVRSIGANQKILNELNLAYTRLLTNTDITLVKNLIKEYKDSIEAGLIEVVDKRPEKK